MGRGRRRLRRLPRRVQGRGRSLIAWAASLALGGDAERGALLAGLAGCEACHTAEDGPPFAGGHAIETPFGTFYGTNLTQDAEHGLGGWTEADFVRAMRTGRSPEGRAYWPAFPFPSFSRLTDGDLADLWAFVSAIAAVPRPDVPQDPRPSRLELWAWRWVAFAPREWKALPDPVLDRGAYLGEVVGHCGECHTERNALGRPKRARTLQGAPGPPYAAPDLTPTALGSWSDADLLAFLETGIEPDGDVTGRGMRHVIRDGTARLTEDDRRALVAWLRSVPPSHPTPR